MSHGWHGELPRARDTGNFGGEKSEEKTSEESEVRILGNLSVQGIMVNTNFIRACTLLADYSTSKKCTIKLQSYIEGDIGMEHTETYPRVMIKGKGYR